MPPCFFDLSVRTKLRVTGADRVRFLNGQTTNDVRKSNERETQESCVLNAKGHLEADLFLFSIPEAIWIDADEELRERLAARLERYVIADDVVIEDVTDEFALFHVIAEAEPRIPEMKFCLKSHRLFRGGWDVWGARGSAGEMKQELANKYQFIEPEALETLRIEDGIPRWDRELTNEIIPPEAGLDKRAIDYEKGCYIGQEVISRMKRSGQRRQRLCGVTATEKLFAGLDLHATGKIVGKITSATFSPQLGAHIALAMIKRGFTEPGSELSADGGLTVSVTTLPFRCSWQKSPSITF
jgi:folate-binding protein YgfZ